jgi:hypothetical protein
MTSLQAIEPGQYSWDGSSAVANIDVLNATLGKCAGVSKLQLVALPCDERQNFMCEKRPPKTTTIAPESSEYTAFNNFNQTALASAHWMLLMGSVLVLKGQKTNL